MNKRILTTLVGLLISSYSLAGGFRNLGHRVGGGVKEYHKDLPENSLSALRASLIGRDDKRGSTPIQFHERFTYLEFDVQETADGRLVLFHDKYLKRMLPNNKKNKSAYDKILKDLKQKNAKFKGKIKKLRIRDLSYDQLSLLTFKGTENESVPLLEEFMNKAKAWGLLKPLILEIKYIHSDYAREKLIELMVDFRDYYAQTARTIFENAYDMSDDGVAFLAFKRNFKKSFGRKKKSRAKWCKTLRENGFYSVHRAMFHSNNLCEI